MLYNFARPLVDHEGVDAFLENCLGLGFDSDEMCLDDGRKIKLTAIAQLIRDAESALGTTDNDQTYTSKKNRVKEYREDYQRKKLKDIILGELISLDRIDDDDSIELGVGGAKPKGIQALAEKQAFIIIGLPASGKSSTVNRTADNLGAFIIDSDFAKRKFPEYSGSAAGANLVHEEASEVVFGAPSLLGYCRAEGLNVVIPKIGNNYDSIVKLRDSLILDGYSVHLTATLLSRENATLRAMSRFINTKRYVPLGLIFDKYANDPIMNYYRFRCEDVKNPGKWKSLGAIDTTQYPAVCVDYNSESNPAFLSSPGGLK